MGPESSPLLASLKRTVFKWHEEGEEVGNEDDAAADDVPAPAEEVLSEVEK